MTHRRLLPPIDADQRGLTLIEILVAFTILTIAGLGLFSLGSTSTTENTRNIDQIAAAALASAKLEDLRNTSYGALTNVTNQADPNNPLTAGGAGGGIFTRTWTIADTTISGVSTSAKTLSVTVEWTNGGPITMSTMVVNPSQVVSGVTSGFPTASIKSMEQTQ